MSAKTILKAAALMRERAEVIQTWARENPESSGWPVAWFSPVFIENAFAEHAFGDSDDPALREGWQADGEHIAPWTPAVALAVAEWLEATARELAALGDPDLAARPLNGRRTAAFAVACAYLGGSA